MNQSGYVSLKPIIESSDGEHISIYISNFGSILELKKRVRESAKIARNFLSPAIEPSQIDDLLAPIERLSRHGHLLRKFSGSLVIFRAKNFLRVLSLPMEVNNLCIVASTFHVKPVLKWSQTNRDFILLGLEKNMAHLYQSSMGKVLHIDSILFPEVLRSFFAEEEYGRREGSWIRRELLLETWDWIDSWLEEIHEKQRPELFVAGERFLAESLISRVGFSPKHPEPISQFFETGKLHNVVAKIREVQHRESELALQNAIIDFPEAQKNKTAQANLFEISKSAINGDIKKLVISEERSIFGRICQETGGLTMHPMNLDHEDDDILDDLAQQVLKKGGQVIVAPDEKIPERRPAIAILKSNAGFKIFALIGLVGILSVGALLIWAAVSLFGFSGQKLTSFSENEKVQSLATLMSDPQKVLTEDCRNQLGTLSDTEALFSEPLADSFSKIAAACNVGKGDSEKVEEL